MTDPLEAERLWSGERIEPDELVAETKERFSPVATFCLFSGGNDSVVVAHRLRGQYDALVWIDTGTACPGVREHVISTAEWLGVPLKIYPAPDGAFEKVVLRKPGFGFPGPAQHSVAYHQLKDRAVEALVREHKVTRSTQKVALLTGMRRQESQRRMGFRLAVRTKAAQVWCNPIIDWTNREMGAYRRSEALPESDVSALLHRSGECNCGAFAAPGEREQLQAIWPDWFDGLIGALERRARTEGKQCAVWGEPRCFPGNPNEPGPLCSDCQLRMEPS